MLIQINETEFRDFLKSCIDSSVSMAVGKSLEKISPEIPLDEFPKTKLTKEWYMLPECARLKGLSDQTLRNKPYLKPDCGANVHAIGGRERWHRSVVLLWLDQDDEELRQIYYERRKKRSSA